MRLPFSPALRVPATLLLGLTIAGCQMNAQTLEQGIGSVMQVSSLLDTSPERQMRLGSAGKQAVLSQYSRSRDRRTEAKLNRIVRNIAQANGLGGYPWEVHLLRGDNVNAFTPGGGVIFVEEALLAQTPDEAMIAMVLAHEMAHSTAAHAVEGMRDRALIGTAGNALSSYVGGASTGLGNAAMSAALNLTMNAAVNGYGRSNEREADRLGFDYYVAAGYRPADAPRIFEEFHRLYGSRPSLPHFFHGSHPQADDRARRVAEMVADLPPARQGQGIAQTQEWASLYGRYAGRRQ